MAEESAQSSPSAEVDDGVPELFQRSFPDVTFQAGRNAAGQAILSVDRKDAARVLRGCKEDPSLGFDYLRNLCGVDLEAQGIEVVYHLLNMRTKQNVAIKTVAPADDCWVEAITPFWPGANWHERETREMFGVEFVGHPDPRNLLLDEDMTIHPLLKAHPLADIELFQGVDVF